MPSLRQLLTLHPSLLLLDAASARVQVGWLRSDAPPRWASSETEAGLGVFQCVEDLGVTPRDAGAFVFCEGPGSILGIRTVAMAIRAWNVITPRPVFTYRSLAIVAHAAGEQELTVIADARRDAWHCLTVSSPLRRVATAGLPESLAMPAGFRHWTALPPRVRMLPYDLAAILPAIADQDLFQKTDTPDAFLHEEPSYVTWTPHIHRAS